MSGEFVCTLAGDMGANLGQQAAQKAVGQMALEELTSRISVQAGLKGQIERPN